MWIKKVLKNSTNIGSTTYETTEDIQFYFSKNFFKFNSTKNNSIL